MQNYSPSLFDVTTVSDLTAQIKSTLESQFDYLTVEGEVSQPTLASSGHLYFTLKDDKAQISCVMWRGQRNRTKTNIIHGQQVRVIGGITLYEKAGRYQIIAQEIHQAGIGALQAAFEKLKKNLEKEGLFRPEIKKEIPLFPKKIGVITSETSAAWHDIQINLEKRWPHATVCLYHASTQGVTASAELTQGIRYFQNHPVDTIIIGRGGGSLEDLWPFNEEALARAIYEIDIPVISGVGHETDYTICDFVSDLRANTPTQAAILATPDANEYKQRIDDAQLYLLRLMESHWQRKHEYITRNALNSVRNQLKLKIENAKFQVNQASKQIKTTINERMNFAELLIQKSSVKHLKEKLEFGISQKRNEVNQQKEAIDSIVEHKLIDLKDSLSEFNHRLELNNPLLPMEKGFTRIEQEGKLIKSMHTFKDSADFTVIWKDGKKEIVR